MRDEAEASQHLTTGTGTEQKDAASVNLMNQLLGSITRRDVEVNDREVCTDSMYQLQASMTTLYNGPQPCSLFEAEGLASHFLPGQ